MSGRVIRSERASFGQEQLWLAEQVSPGTAGFHTVRMWELRGELDVGALQSAVDLLVRRHEPLRTTLHLDGSGLRQRVERPRPVPIERFELARVAEPDLDQVRALLKRPFDLAEDLAFRALLGRVGPGHHVFVMNVHHSACDSWSFLIIREELALAYAAYSDGREPDLPEPGTPYADFSRRERAWWDAGGQRMSRRWLRSLEEIPSLHTPLPGAGRRDLMGPVGALHQEVRSDALRGLLAKAAAAGATPNMAVVALFVLLLSRWTGRDRVFFSTPVGTRLEPDVERSVGFFVNSLPIVVDVGGCRDFDELLGRVRPAVLNAIMHAQVPPGEVRAAMSGGVSSSDFDPMHAVTLAVETWAPATFALGRLEATDRFIHPGVTTFGLSVRVEVGDEGARVFVEYDTEAIPSEVASRFAAHFDELITAAGTRGLLADLPAIPEGDRERLARWTTGPRPRGGTGLPARVAEHVAARPDAVAVDDGTRELSYRDLWAAAGALAADLRARGIGQEDLVAISMPRSAHLLVAVLGVLRAGAAFAPIDPRDPEGRRQGVLRRCRALVVEDAADAGGWDGTTVVVGDAVQDTGLATVADVVPSADALAYVIHTSGSTGRPKGVMITHGGLANYLDWAVSEYGLEPGTTVPLHTSVAFDLAITSLLGPLHAGARVHVLPESAGPLAAAPHLGDGYRMVKTTPSHLRALLDHAGDAELPGVVVLGGENLPAGQVRGLVSRSPRPRVVNEYGPTETVVGSTAFIADAPGIGDVVPIGVPIANTTAHVVDSDLRPLPVGVRGELVIGGAGVARGYLGAPGLTADRFVPDPSGHGERWYRTGDLAFWRADGVLELVGRLDDQLKLLGYRVEPGEVEGVLANAPGVRQAAVVVDRRGQDPRLVGFLHAAGAVDDAFLAGVEAHLRYELPAHMVPDELVPVDEMPVDGNGKTDRSALRLPEVPVPVAPPPRDRPPGYWHDLVHAAWAQTLAVAEVSPDVSFFEAGGTSLLLIKLNAALTVRGVTGLSVTDLFRFPTIDALAVHLADGSAAADPGTVTDTGAGTDAAGERAVARRERLRRARSRRDDR
ncbi:amino acid adenylation domain-containing protein [Lentzea sp. NPDC059081]|uniref:non-ribosomal peptide synthetase n=1 Tax=Lentzea sp. NPDC059081 TaxID=3346719 RepID=UPI0036924968